MTLPRPGLASTSIPDLEVPARRPHAVELPGQEVVSLLDGLELPGGQQVHLAQQAEASGHGVGAPTQLIHGLLLGQLGDGLDGIGRMALSEQALGVCDSTFQVMAGSVLLLMVLAEALGRGCGLSPVSVGLCVPTLSRSGGLCGRTVCGHRPAQVALGISQGFLGHGPLALEGPEDFAELDRILRGDRLELTPGSFHTGLEPGDLSSERLDLDPEMDRRLGHRGWCRRLGQSARGLGQPFLHPPDRRLQAGDALGDEPLLPTERGPLRRYPRKLLRGRGDLHVALLDLTANRLGVGADVGQALAALAQRPPDPGELALQPRRVAPDLLQTGVPSQRRPHEGRPNHRPVDCDERRVRVDAVLGHGLGEVVDDVDLTENLTDDPPDPWIRPHRTVEASLPVHGG